MGFFILVLLIAAPGQYGALAADPLPVDPPERTTTIVVSYNQTLWWVIRWSDNTILCSVKTDHEGLPNGEEIYAQCGKTIYNLWVATPACQPEANDAIGTKYCQGVYLFMVDNKAAEKTIQVELPQPEVWLTLGDCQVLTSERHCAALPSLILTAEEPLPNEHITAIHALINGRSFHCNGNTCKIPLSSTTMVGSSVEFWADSSFGDSSKHFTALVRVVDNGVAASPMGGGWFVDVISTQWLGGYQSTCAQIWGVFPPLGELPNWLLTPEFPALIASDAPFQYLAGRLIANGVVDGSSCLNFGLLPNGYADACGTSLALPIVEQWQNQFDVQILEVAQEKNIPGQLLKNLFAQESQFWPGMFKDPKEYGLGQLTDNGADSLLLWNPSFFTQFCPLVLNEDHCDRGYVYLSASDQALLRGALAVKVNADCSDCAAGIDLQNAHFSIDLFAQTLIANCAQVSRIVYNATSRSPAVTTDYESLWRFTVANYHVGAGCVSYAIYTTWNNRQQLNWENVAKNFTPACQGVVSYVEKVTP